MGRKTLLALAVLIVAACGGIAGPSSAATDARPAGEVSVFAAASLTEAFREASGGFRKAYPAVTVSYNFAGTPALVTQIQQGAPADVLASADEASMQNAVGLGLLGGTPRRFARNRLQIVVATGNPKRIAGLTDLARPDVLFITEAASVPAGRYAAQALAAAGVRANPRSLEPDVKSVVSKVALGEADAGIVYVTDVRAAGSRVTGVAIPDVQNVVATYPVAEVRGGRNPAAARAFIDYLLSPAGQDDLVRLGFSRP